jgi:hypothetical protein
MDGPRVRRVGLLVNPRSGKSSGKGLALAARLAGSRHVTVKILERFEQLPQALDEMAHAEVSDLFISSGDGTVHAIQTELIERRPFRALPRLGLLAHGTTNMTAADLGFRHRSVAAQAAFLGDVRAADLRTRPTLRVVNPRDGKPRHGMCLGAGAAAEATRFCQDAFNAKGLKGGPAIFLTMAGGVVRALFTTPDPSDTTRFDRAYPIGVEAEGCSIPMRPHLLLLSTTLEKVVLGIRPFWGGKTGPIRTSLFPYPLPSVVRWLLPMMYGGETRKAPPGAVSFCASKLSIATPASFVLDGEFFDPPEHDALRVETGPDFTYVCG